jgi:hypothetical protein
LAEQLDRLCAAVMRKPPDIAAITSEALKRISIQGHIPEAFAGRPLDRISRCYRSKRQEGIEGTLMYPFGFDPAP